MTVSSINDRIRFYDKICSPELRGNIAEILKRDTSFAVCAYPAANVISAEVGLELVVSTTSYSAHDRGAEYCDERVCLRVCMPVLDHIFETTRPIFTSLCACYRS